MFAIRTIRTYVPGTAVHESMANHFVFSLEALAAFAAWTAFDGTVMCADLAVDVAVGAARNVSLEVTFAIRGLGVVRQEILRLERRGVATRVVASIHIVGGHCHSGRWW